MIIMITLINTADAISLTSTVIMIIRYSLISKLLKYSDYYDRHDSFLFILNFMNLNNITATMTFDIIMENLAILTTFLSTTVKIRIIFYNHYRCFNYSDHYQYDDYHDCDNYHDDLYYYEYLDNYYYISDYEIMIHMISKKTMTISNILRTPVILNILIPSRFIVDRLLQLLRFSLVR